MYTVYFDHIHTFPAPPFQLLLSSTSLSLPFQLCVFFVLIAQSAITAAHPPTNVAPSTGTVNLSKTTPLKKIDSASPGSCQLSIAHHLGVGTSVASHIYAGMLTGLILCRQTWMLWVPKGNNPVMSKKQVSSNPS